MGGRLNIDGGTLNLDGDASPLQRRPKENFLHSKSVRYSPQNLVKTKKKEIGLHSAQN